MATIQPTRTRLLVVALMVSAGYIYAQSPQDPFVAFGALRGEQGDPAELPPREWPDRDTAGCHMYYTSVRRESNGSGWRRITRGHNEISCFACRN